MDGLSSLRRPTRLARPWCGRWCDAHAGGETSVMIAHRRRDVAELNARARTQLRASGRIGDDLVAQLSAASRSGDRVVTTRNDRSIGVVNGQAGTVAGLREGELEVRFDDGRWVRLPEPYVLAGHLDHGYALTAHRAQGATVDRAFVLGSDELYREWGYTALSRHRIEARFYVTATPTYLNEPPGAARGWRGRHRQGRPDARGQRRKDAGGGRRRRGARARSTRSTRGSERSSGEHANTRRYQASATRRARTTDRCLPPRVARAADLRHAHDRPPEQAASRP